VRIVVAERSDIDLDTVNSFVGHVLTAIGYI